MSSPYVGEIRMFGGNFAPAGWAFCNGATVPISENETLFNLIGTTYGGDGQETFNLPNLQSRVPIHQGSGFILGQTGGVETVTLTTNQIPNHTHIPQGSTANGNATTPAGGISANFPDGAPYNAAVGPTNMNASALGTSGGSQPHDNMIPFLCVSFIISLFGLFPHQ
ncbi:MAG TPA: tail fiber protein [Pyrinomonadaceae bacterium]